MLIKTKNRGWELAPGISADDIPDLSPVPREKQPWEYLYEAMRGVFNVPKQETAGDS